MSEGYHAGPIPYHALITRIDRIESFKPFSLRSKVLGGDTQWLPVAPGEPAECDA